MSDCLLPIPAPQNVERVMKETGMDEMQAINHERVRMFLVRQRRDELARQAAACADAYAARTQPTTT